MKVLVTGVNGQLGYDVVKELEKRCHQPIGVDKEEMDLTSTEQVRECIESVNPQAIIHCAAYTAVDAAEDNEELCKRINAIATKEIAEHAKKMDIPMIYISTDYVFDGTKGIDQNSEAEVATTSENCGEIFKNQYQEYVETDTPNPTNVYGKTKYEGEVYVQEILEKYYIVRISWVFGENGNNFIDTMLRLSKDRDKLNVISDQVGSPTYTKDLAPLLIDMIETDKYGIYHATNEGYCTWYEFAKEIFNISNVDIDVRSISTAEYPTKATRPMNSKMNKEKIENNKFKQLRNWKDALREYIENN